VKKLILPVIIMLVGLGILIPSPASAAPPAGCFASAFDTHVTAYTDSDGTAVHGSSFYSISTGFPATCAQIWLGHQNQCATMRIDRVTPSKVLGPWLRVCDTPVAAASVACGWLCGGDLIQVVQRNSDVQFKNWITTGTVWH
jgi:hypothetical protein